MTRRTLIILSFVILVGCASRQIPPTSSLAISTPALVVDMDTFTSGTSVSSTSATPSEHAVILKFCGTVDGGIRDHDVPTDDWANTPAWTELEDENLGATVASVAWTTTGVSPGAGQVTQGFSEDGASIVLVIIEVTGAQLRSPIVASNSGNVPAPTTTLSITVSGTLGPNDAMVSFVMSRQDTDGLTATGNNNELDDEVTGGGFSSSGQVQENSTDLVASWSDIDGSTIQGAGVAVHVRGLRNVLISEEIKVRVLFRGEWKS